MTKILILGGGFGGVRCAVNLEKQLKGSSDITLVDRQNFHLFVPAIYEVASAYGMKNDPYEVRLKKTVSLPFADIFEDRKINFVQAEIASIDIANKKVKTRGDHTLDYDYLVLALGAEAADFNIPGVQDYAHSFKTLDDALFINQKLNELSEELLNKHRTEPYTFLVCGAGFTGVELAAELGSCSSVIARQCQMKGRCSSITLFEAGPKMLPHLHDKERKIIKNRLTALGIVLMENSPIEEVGPTSIKLKSGQTLNGDLIIWTAGTKPNRLLSSVNGLNLSKSGRIATDKYLRMDGSDNIFALGDNMEFIDSKTQRPIPALAYSSANQGKVVADNIVRAINSKPLKNYTPVRDTFIVPVGGKFALAHFLGMTITGFIGWVARTLADFRYFLNILPFKKALQIYWGEMSVFTKND